MKIDHQWAGNAFDGKHLQIQLPPIAAPALDGGDGCVYAGSTGGITELFYKDSAGHLVQLTANGGCGGSVIVSGRNSPRILEQRPSTGMGTTHRHQ
jgi:hypothetical protein